MAEHADIDQALAAEAVGRVQGFRDQGNRETPGVLRHEEAERDRRFMMVSGNHRPSARTGWLDHHHAAAGDHCLAGDKAVSG